MKTTFKSFYEHALFENAGDLTVYEIDLDGIPYDELEPQFYELMVQNGLLYTKPGTLVGLKADIISFMKGAFTYTKAEAEADMTPSTTYVATPAITPRKLNELNEFINSASRATGKERLTFGVKKLKTSKKMVGTDIIIIHKKTEHLENIERVGLYQTLPSPYLGDYGHDWGKGADSVRNAQAKIDHDNALLHRYKFLVAVPADQKEYDPLSDPNFKWIDSHLHEITTDAQKKNGSYAFHLPAPKREILLISSTGYVRIDPNRQSMFGPAANRVLFKPVGDTPEERLKNAFAYAVSYIKKSA